MTIISRNFQERPILTRECLRRVTETARRHEGVAPGTVGFAFVDDRDMSQHHRRFLGAATTTDVLSFPNLFARATGGEPGRTELDGESYWGDVIICTDEAARQAVELGHPYGYELRVLALHGVLHLLGFDHVTDDGSMRRLEEKLRPRCVCSTSCR